MIEEKKIGIRPYGHGPNLSDLPMPEGKTIPTCRVYMHYKLDTDQETDLTECFYNIPEDLIEREVNWLSLHGDRITGLHNEEKLCNAQTLDEFLDLFYREVVVIRDGIDVEIQGNPKPCIGRFVSKKNFVKFDPEYFKELRKKSKFFGEYYKNRVFTTYDTSGLVVYKDDVEGLHSIIKAYMW